MNLSDIAAFTDRKWDEDLVPRLVDYVRVPAKSPAFDASWAAHGYLDGLIAATRDPAITEAAMRLSTRWPLLPVQEERRPGPVGRRA